MTIWLVTLILVVAMLLLISEKLPVDLTSIGIIVVLGSRIYQSKGN